jgi:protein-histidine N-methyltransferase
MTAHADTGLADLTSASACSQEDDSDALKMERFLRWMQENGATLPSMTMVVEKNGRNAYTTQTITAGELALHVPRKLMITPEMARQSEVGQEIVAHGSDIDIRDFLAAFVLQIKREGGFWKPYVDVLPSDYSHIPVCFSDEELKHLEGSYALDLIRGRRRDEAEAYAALPPSLTGSWLTWEDFVWALCLIKSRLYNVSFGGKRSSAMVPLADMFDHSPSRNLAWVLDSDTGFLMTARKDIEQGSLMLESYGSRCNVRMLCTYGFCLEDNDANEAQFLLPPLMLSHPYAEHGRKLGWPQDDMRAFRAPGVYLRDETRQLFSYARMYCLGFDGTPAESLPAIGLENTDHVRAISRENEIAVLSMIGERSRQAMQRFPTTVAEDDALLQDTSLSNNVRNMIIARRGEKVALQYFIDLADTAIPVLRDPSSVLSEYAVEGKRFALYFADIDEGMRSWAKA